MQSVSENLSFPLSPAGVAEAPARRSVDEADGSGGSAQAFAGLLGQMLDRRRAAEAEPAAAGAGAQSVAAADAEGGAPVAAVGAEVGAGLDGAEAGRQELAAAFALQWAALVASRGAAGAGQATSEGAAAAASPGGAGGSPGLGLATQGDPSAAQAGAGPSLSGAGLAGLPNDSGDFGGGLGALGDAAGAVRGALGNDAGEQDALGAGRDDSESVGLAADAAAAAQAALGSFGLSMQALNAGASAVPADAAARTAGMDLPAVVAVQIGPQLSVLTTRSAQAAPEADLIAYARGQGVDPAVLRMVFGPAAGDVTGEGGLAAAQAGGSAGAGGGASQGGLAGGQVGALAGGLAAALSGGSAMAAAGSSASGAGQALAAWAQNRAARPLGADASPGAAATELARRSGAGLLEGINATMAEFSAGPEGGRSARGRAGEGTVSAATMLAAAMRGIGGTVGSAGGDGLGSAMGSTSGLAPGAGLGGAGGAGSLLAAMGAAGLGLSAARGSASWAQGMGSADDAWTRLAAEASASGAAGGLGALAGEAQGPMAGSEALWTDGASAASRAQAVERPAVAAALDMLDLRARAQEDHEALSERVARSLAQRLVDQIEKGQWQLRLNVNPRELGPIDIELRVSGQRVDAQFQVAHAQTQALIQDTLPKLREAVGNSGMDLASVWVSGGWNQRDRGNPTPGQPDDPALAQGAAALADDDGIPVAGAQGLDRSRTEWRPGLGSLDILI